MLLADGAASSAARRPDESARIHLVVRRDVQGAGDPGAEQRLPGTCLADGQRFNVQAVGPLHVAQVHQGPAVGRIGTHRQGRRRQVTGVPAGGERGRKLRPPGGGFQHQFQEPFLLVMQFADRGQHAGRSPACTAARGFIDEHHRTAGAPCLPGDAVAHHAAANDGYIGLKCAGLQRARGAFFPLVSGFMEFLPYAGTNRIRSSGRL